MHLIKSVTMFKYHDVKFNSDIWCDLKSYLLQEDPDVAGKDLYVCQHCRPILNSNKMPGRCVLNGLWTVPVPEELSKLNPVGNSAHSASQVFPNSCEIRNLHRKNSYLQCSEGCQGNNVFLTTATREYLGEAG